MPLHFPQHWSAPFGMVCREHSTRAQKTLSSDRVSSVTEQGLFGENDLIGRLRLGGCRADLHCHAAFDAAGGALVHRTELGGLVSGGSEQIVSFLGSGFVTGLDRGKRDFTSQFDIGLDRAVTSRANLGLTDAFES